MSASSVPAPAPPTQIIALGRSPLIASKISSHLLPHNITMNHFLTPSPSLAYLLRTILSSSGCEIEAVVLGAIFPLDQVEALKDEVYSNTSTSTGTATGHGSGGDQESKVKAVPFLMVSPAMRDRALNTGGAGGIWAMDAEAQNVFTKDTADSIKRGLDRIREEGNWGKVGVWEGH